MAQVYKMMLGTSGKQWEQLTVSEDGTMMLYFHGTDRSVTTQVTLIEDGAWKGWLRSEGGSLYPGIESGKWQAVDDGRGKMEDVRGKMEDVVETADCTDCTDNEVCVPATVEPIMADSPQLETSGYCSRAELEQLREENQRLQEQIEAMAAEPYRGQSPCNPLSATHTGDSPRVRRQRKQRKPRVERQTSSIDHQTSSIDHQPSAISHQTSSTLKAVGMVAAATVALLVIYETGLLIPLGLIGLASGGLLK